MIVTKESHTVIPELWYADVLFYGKMFPHDTAFGQWRRSKVDKSESHQIIWRNSLFGGGLESYDERAVSMSLDVILGALTCWDKELSCAVDEIYRHEFSDALNSLECKKDHEWVSCVPLDSVPFNSQKVDEEHPTDLQ